MNKNPTDRWGAWLEAAGAENMVSYTCVRDVIWPELRKEGFAVPVQRSLQQTLAAGLEALPTKLVNDRMSICSSFEHMLKLFWVPLLEYMDSFTSEAAPEWTENLALNHTVLLSEMAGNNSVC